MKNVFMTQQKMNLIDCSTLTRDEVVPYYVDLIVNIVPYTEILRVNNLILSKWSSSGLEYIKNKAWKQVDLMKNQTISQ